MKSLLLSGQILIPQYMRYNFVNFYQRYSALAVGAKTFNTNVTSRGHFHRYSKISVTPSSLEQVLQEKKLPIDNIDTLQLFIDFGLSHEQVVKVVNANTKNSTLWSNNEVRKALENLVEVGGFDKEAIYRILCSGVPLECLSAKGVFNAFQNLRNLDFSNKLIVQILSSNPKLLHTDYKTLCEAYEGLDQNFTKKDIEKLVSQHPKILTYPWEENFSKLCYVCLEMGLNQTDAREANLFKYSIEHIRARHQILQRAGCYVRPNPKHKMASTNPTLTEILRASDEKFLSTYTSISLDEYNAFCQLLAVEYEADSFLSEQDEIDE